MLLGSESVVLQETWLKGRESITTLELSPERRQRLITQGYASTGTEDVEDMATSATGGGLVLIPTGYGAGEEEKVELPPKEEETPPKTEIAEEEEQKKEKVELPTEPEAEGFDFAKFLSGNWLWLLLLLLLIAIIIMAERED
jgi:hypothetical protein